ncbi:MAG: DegT/DnrJ/EryC1/StrS family aminotransferase [Candidatus ainarchaeum sp.]|nr:DegT/DnrJ/EryC1/StrS family aminotransferase [Candidatus ainarchaeum sp.]MDD5096793.1 DegT/DnrJ/EryC1/StrS family aminotransferase [Candidatus ainarchaeum sp.]
MERISDLERKYVLEALSNGFRTSLNSVFNSRLEQKFAQAFRSKYAIGHVNGTATMHTALVALGVKPGDEVIVPPLTMSSTSLCVLQNGSIPVFADVDRDTFTISPDSIRKCITKKTRAIITVSLYGLSPDYDEIVKICKEHNLFLIEDNAECFLGEYKGKLAGEFGDFSSYSFQASKHMTCGEGGMLTTNSEELADRARKFSSLGYAGVSANKGKITKNDIQDPRYSRHVTLGFNYRMSEVAAAVALGQLERLGELVGQRVKVAKMFADAVEGSEGVLLPQAEPAGYKNSFWAYSAVLQTERPETDWYKFREIFQKNGGDGYYSAWKLTYQEPLFSGTIQKQEGIWQKYLPGLCPVAEYLQLRMLQFKTNYWELEEAGKQAEILRKSIKEFRAGK